MANIQNVAKKAGVSISTVSRVLNGTAKVNDAIKQRVEASMQDLHYEPNPAARSLRTNRSRIIGLIISDIQNSFFIELIRGVEEETLHHEYSLILCNSNEDYYREQQYLNVLYSERVAGVIIVPTGQELGDGILNKYIERKIPIITVDRRVKNVDAVLVDNIRGAYDAVTHLIKNGYRRIGAITGPLAVTTGHDRLMGYRQALIDAHITPDPSLERSGSFSAGAGRNLTDELLQISPPIDALFLGNNLLTMGAWDSVHAHNLKVPQDIAMVGYDEIFWSSLNTISLTTVTQPVFELGRAATARLFTHLQNSAIKVRQEVLLTPALNIRGSSLSKEVLSFKIS